MDRFLQMPASDIRHQPVCKKHSTSLSHASEDNHTVKNEPLRATLVGIHILSWHDEIMTNGWRLLVCVRREAPALLRTFTWSLNHIAVWHSPFSSRDSWTMTLKKKWMFDVKFFLLACLCSQSQQESWLTQKREEWTLNSKRLKHKRLVIPYVTPNTINITSGPAAMDLSLASKHVLVTLWYCLLLN